MADQAQERWLTYAELGELLGCTASTARARARRHGWPRRAANAIGGALVLVLVLSLPVSATAAAHHRCPSGSEWVRSHRNPVGHWIKGHCFITRPLSVPRHLPS